MGLWPGVGWSRRKKWCEQMHRDSKAQGMPGNCRSFGMGPCRMQKDWKGELRPEGGES